MKTIAIVTGANGGFGKELTSLLVKEKQINEIWAIARNEKKLESLKEELGDKIRPISLDMSNRASFDALEAMLRSEPLRIAYLVNNAGFAKFGDYADVGVEESLNMIDLNCKALTAITYISLNYMQAGSRVYQLGSLSSFQPVPYIATYGATKAYVLSFTRAINKELEERGIKMIAVCPGWVKTEFFDRAVTDDTIKYYNRFFTSEEVVRRAVYDMYRGRDVSVCGADIRGQVLLTKLLPHKLVMKIWCRQQGK
jgi:short-subunit dehydrogenase